VKRTDVVKKGDQLVAESNKQVVAKSPTKDAPVKRTAAIAKADPNALTVKIHKLDGRIHLERSHGLGLEDYANGCSCTERVVIGRWGVPGRLRNARRTAALRGGRFASAELPD
jgi:hypothetical protein